MHIRGRNAPINASSAQIVSQADMMDFRGRQFIAIIQAAFLFWRNSQAETAWTGLDQRLPFSIYASAPRAKASFPIDLHNHKQSHSSSRSHREFIVDQAIEGNSAIPECVRPAAENGTAADPREARTSFTLRSVPVSGSNRNCDRHFGAFARPGFDGQVPMGEPSPFPHRCES